jgi:Fe(3+) dicitrate transport protein
LEEIQIIRGAASLRNSVWRFSKFQLKSPTENLELTTRNTLGSYGLYTNFTSISGTNESLAITVSIITKGNGLDPILILSKSTSLILITSSMTKHRYTLIIPILPI